MKCKQKHRAHESECGEWRKRSKKKIVSLITFRTFHTSLCIAHSAKPTARLGLLLIIVRFYREAAHTDSCTLACDANRSSSTAQRTGFRACGHHFSSKQGTCYGGVPTSFAAALFLLLFVVVAFLPPCRLCALFCILKLFKRIACGHQ